MRLFFQPGLIIWAAFLVAGCSKHDAEAEGADPHPRAFDGISLEQVGANGGVMAPRQNAQNIATTAAAARAAGYDQPWVSKEEAVADVVRGISFQLGTQQMKFSSGSMGTAEQQEAMAFLIFDPNSPGTLRFTNEVQP